MATLLVDMFESNDVFKTWDAPLSDVSNLGLRATTDDNNGFAVQRRIVCSKPGRSRITRSKMAAQTKAIVLKLEAPDLELPTIRISTFDFPTLARPQLDSSSLDVQQLIITNTEPSFR